MYRSDWMSNLLYKCPELKSKNFEPQEKRERKICKTVGVRGCVHACMQLGGGLAERKKNIERESKRDRKKKE
jgi:hypothetical protein